jgi:putative ABC transport system ATP-binding protein
VKREQLQTESGHPKECTEESGLLLGEVFIELDNVSKVYRLGEKEIPVLRKVNLEINEDEFVVVWGPSGSGKTTLLNIIGGLDTPTTGTVTVMKSRVDNAEEDFLSSFRYLNIGFVFQHYNLVSTFTAIENVEFPVEICGENIENAAKVAKNLLRKVGLADRAMHLPAQLSGGEQQRLAFARALANDPPILLIDEPTGNLDATSQRKIVAILNELKRRRKTIVVVTHDDSILKLADRSLKLEDGKLR